MNVLRAALVASAAALLGPIARAEAPAAARALSLDEALGELERQNLTLRQARARREEAAGLARQALAAALPTLTATGGYVHNSDAAVAPFSQIAAILAPGGPPVPNLLIQPREVFTVNGTARLPLLAPTAWADVAAARSAERASEESAEAVRLQLRAALVQAAWTTSAVDEIVAASERALSSAEEQASLAERALAAGTGVPLAVLQARTEAVRRRSDLVRARADRARAELSAGVLLGRAQPVRILVPALSRPASPDPRALRDEAERRRPELRADAAQVEAAERRVTSARLRLLPQVSASASAFAQTEPLPTLKESGWRLTVDLTWALYDGGFRYGKARQEEGALAEARASLEAERVAVAQEVDDAARDVDLAVERLGLAEEQARLAGEAAATARRGFAGGVASSLDVLEANDRLFQSEVGLADARARLGISLAALDRAVGRS
jgi:outer membrane protein TolC